MHFIFVFVLLKQAFELTEFAKSITEENLRTKKRRNKHNEEKKKLFTNKKFKCDDCLFVDKCVALYRSESVFSF